MTEKQLFIGLQKGLRSAERQLYVQFKPACLHYAQAQFFWKSQEGWSKKCSPEDAEEIYNDACALLIQQILNGRIQELHCKISTYLIKTMQYKWMNKARRQQRQLPIVSPEEEKAAKLEILRQQVRSTIKQLGVKCREMTNDKSERKNF